MKLSYSLLQSVALGVAVSLVASGCYKNDLNSGAVKKDKKTKKENVVKDDCPTCGMG